MSYLWIAEPEVQTAEVGEEAEASEENPVLETGNKQVGGGSQIKTIGMDGWTASHFYPYCVNKETCTPAWSLTEVLLVSLYSKLFLSDDQQS